MRDYSLEPRVAIDNSSAFRYKSVLEDPWTRNYSAISSANDGLRAIANGMEFGDDGENTMRAKAFAKFVQGLCHGNIALQYDKGYILDENSDLSAEVPELKPYSQVMDAAIQMLEEAVQLFDNNSFVLPNTWINGLTPTNTDLSKLVHSHIARFLSLVARTPEEKTAVDWNAVMTHAQQGITEDFAPIGDNETWWDALKYSGNLSRRCRADYKTIGVTDTSGNYQQWLASDLANRTPFLIYTADRRITAEGDPEGDGLYFGYKGASNFNIAWGMYHHSMYMHIRYMDHRNSGRTSEMPAFLVTEVRLLEAEARYRLGMGGVADIINETRVNIGGLPPATDSDPDLFEKLKYEKNIELFCTSGGRAFYDKRGWGDLVPGTPYQHPVPAIELELMMMPTYTFGGVGGDCSVQ